jgi:NO-binding membrane sensor protein with MHYT domain
MQHQEHVQGFSLLMQHDPILVVLSFLISILAAYTALITIVHARTNSLTRNRWLWGGATVYGFGVWAMHFTGMSAFNMGQIKSYNLPLTGLSVIFAMLGAYAAFNIISRAKGFGTSLFSGFCLGAGIGAMHYAGMFALRINGVVSFDLIMVGVSVLVAVTIGTLGMWAISTWSSANNTVLNLVTAVITGSAIPLMHYTAMTATKFSGLGTQSSFESSLWVNLVLIIAILVLSIPLIFASVIVPQPARVEA